MLRRFRKRRGDGDGGVELYGSGGPDSKGRDNVRGPLSAPFDEAELDDDHHQLRFKHVLMNEDKTYSDGRRRPSHMPIITRGANKNNNATASSSSSSSSWQQQQHRSITYDDNKILNAIHVQVEPPQKQKKTVQLEQQEARQKLDNSSRQNQRLQRCYSSHSSQAQRRRRRHPGSNSAMKNDNPNDSTALLTVTSNTLVGNGSATTADTSESTPPQQTKPQQQQQEQHREEKQHQLNHSIVPPSSLTRHLAAACGLMKCDGAVELSNLPSSYCPEPDFRSLQVVASAEENTNNLGSPERCHGNVGRARSEVASNAAARRRLHLRRHDYVYRPTPPQKRTSGSNAGSVVGSSSVATTDTTTKPLADKLPNAPHQDRDYYRPTPPQKRASNSTSTWTGQAGERRKISQQTQQHPQHQGEEEHKGKSQKSIPGLETRTKPQVHIIHHKNHDDIILVTPFSKELESSAIANIARDDSGSSSRLKLFSIDSDGGKSGTPIDRMISPVRSRSAVRSRSPRSPESPLARSISAAKSRSPRSPESPPALASWVVTPSPPSKQQSMRQQSRKYSAPPSAAMSGATSPTASTTPTAKIANSSNKVIGRLMKRRQNGRAKTPVLQRQLELEQQQKEASEPKHFLSYDMATQVLQPNPTDEINQQSVEAMSYAESATQPPSPPYLLQPNPTDESNRQSAEAMSYDESTAQPPYSQPRTTSFLLSANKVKREEPPEEVPSNPPQQRRPDPPAEDMTCLSSTLLSDTGNGAIRSMQKQGTRVVGPVQQRSPPNVPRKSLSQLAQSQHLKAQPSQLYSAESPSKSQSKSDPQSQMNAKSHKRIDPSEPSQLQSQTKPTALEPPSRTISQLNTKPHNKQHAEFPPPSPSRVPRSEMQPPSQLRSHKNKMNQQTKEWKTPIPFKKVNSTPSNMSSFFTFQTSNTTSTSKFWDDVEVFTDDPNHAKIKQQRNMGVNRRIVTSKEKQHDEYFNNHLVEVKKSRLGNHNNLVKERDTSQRNSTTDKGSPRDMPPKGTSKSKKSSLNSIHEDDAISNAFSLKLPLNNYGKFDDSDISALQMSDSATVYYQRQLNKENGGASKEVDVDDCGVVATSDYWKKKYERLKEETRGAVLEMAKSTELELVESKEEEEQEEQMQLEQHEQQQLHQQGMASYEKIVSSLQRQQQQQQQEEGGSCGDGEAGAATLKNEGTHVELKKMIDPNNRKIANQADAIGSSLQETNTTLLTDSLTNDAKERGPRCSSPLKAINEIFVEVVHDLDQSLENCEKKVSDYHGGKKGKDRGDDYQLGEIMMNRAQTAREMSVLTMKKTAKEMVNFVSNMEEGMEECSSDKKQQQTKSNIIGTFCHAEEMIMSPEVSLPPQNDAPPLQQECEENKEDDFGPFCKFDEEGEDNYGQSQEMSFETDDTDGQELQLIGYIPREISPSQEKSLRQNNSIPKYEVEEEHDDAKLLQQWNRSRKVVSPKSLADDLTAGASRISRTTDSSQISELSENAKMIFDAALKHDMKALHAQRSGLRSPQRSTVSTDVGRRSSVVSSMADSKSIAASNFGSNIPSDFAGWFELPSPGSTCISLLSLFDASPRNSINARDSTDVSPRFRADDVVDMAFSDFARTCNVEGNELDVDIVREALGPIVANGESGSIRFANASVHLPGISDAAVAAISRRQFHDAIEIYNTLLRSCQTTSATKLGLVGQLIASTLHNLSVLHLWNHEYDQALPYCRESLRIKVELVGDDAGSVNLWSSLGLINYATGSLPAALAAFRKAMQMSTQFIPGGHHLAGQLGNNIGCVNFEIGQNLPLVQSQLKQSLQMQKEGGDADGGGEEDLFSISITMLNVGVVCARQGQNAASITHVKSCFAIQQALLENDNEVVKSTATYLESLLRRRTATMTLPTMAASNKHYGTKYEAPQPMAQHDKGHKRRGIGLVSTNQHEKDEPPQLNKKLFRQQQLPSAADREQVLHAGNRGGQNAPVSSFPAQQGRGDQISHPMLSLGSLRAESTVIQRVQQALEGCADNLTKQGFGRGHHLSQLLCKRSSPHINNSNQKTMSQNIISFGLQTMKKREAQSELNKNLKRFGSRHPRVGESHQSLGLFYLFSENYRDAETHFEHAVRIYTNALGIKHPDVASALMFKGLTHLALEKLDDAMACMLRVRRVREDALGRQNGPHPEIGAILNNMACVQYELGDYKRAESLLQEALDLQREVFTTEPDFLKGVSIVLCNIAFLHAKSGSFPKALIELEGALQIRQDILLEHSSRMSEITENMAHLLAIHQLQHGAVNLDEITEVYITMLRKSERDN